MFIALLTSLFPSSCFSPDLLPKRPFGGHSNLLTSASVSLSVFPENGAGKSPFWLDVVAYAGRTDLSPSAAEPATLLSDLVSMGVLACLARAVGSEVAVATWDRRQALGTWRLASRGVGRRVETFFAGRRDLLGGLFEDGEGCAGLSWRCR